MKRSGRILLAAVAMAGVAAGAEAQETVVKVGVVRSMANGAILLAMEKGYFKEVGIKVELGKGVAAAQQYWIETQAPLPAKKGAATPAESKPVESRKPAAVA